MLLHIMWRQAFHQFMDSPKLLDCLQGCSKQWFVEENSRVRVHGGRQYDHTGLRFRLGWLAKILAMIGALQSTRNAFIRRCVRIVSTAICSMCRSSGVHCSNEAMLLVHSRMQAEHVVMVSSARNAVDSEWCEAGEVGGVG